MTSIVNNYRRALRNVMRQVEAATEEWTININQQALAVTPMDTGELRDSNYVVKNATVNGVEMEVGFKTDYAPIVHEWPSDTNWTTPGTNSKYLQRPFYSLATTLPTYIQGKVRV